MFDDEQFRQALRKPRLTRPAPEFLDANRAVPIPDWRYDPLPDQVYLDITPKGKVRTVIRYIGSGHWDGPLRPYPYDASAPVLYGNGRFIQCPAIDRYHFNEQGLMEEGETLYDAFDVTQRGGILPRDDSWQFRALPAASKVPALLQRFKH